MVQVRSYSIDYAAQTKAHLRTIAPKYHALIRRKIEEQLRFEPIVETVNRKPLRQPASYDAEWEIRFGPNNRFRVLYKVSEVEHNVLILAIGEKDRNRLLVGGEEITL
jgi:mRNA-degrading endonuclease RelE of RelBE toxin-antitoxin system